MNRTVDLAFWINERYSMKMRRDAGLPAPWTGDRIMATTRFCNVHREDDKVTKWLAENWRPRYSKVWHILLARLINNVPTLELLLPQMENLGAMKQVLLERRKKSTIFGSAYTVSTCGLSMDKVDYIFDCVIMPSQRKDIDGFWNTVCEPGSLAQACEDLQRLHGVSTFMAGQLIADLKNTRGHMLENAPDWWTWAAPGPGSLRGLSEYFRRPVTASGFTNALTLCYNEVQPLICNYVPRLHMQDFQNCMCEFSKYVRVKNGGHARNRYTPEAAGGGEGRGQGPRGAELLSHSG